MRWHSYFIIIAADNLTSKQDNLCNTLKKIHGANNVKYKILSKIVNRSNVFEIEVPLIFSPKDIKIKELKIDHNKNWINAH